VRRSIVLVAMASMLLVAGCAGDRRTGGAAPTVGPAYVVNGTRYVPRADPGYAEVGIASWYGREYQGQRTASGERFDRNALTAAHKTLPLSSYVRVTNLTNGRSVVLRINDRGPFVRGRIVDVSERAAETLGFTQQGTTRVRVEAVPRPS
jgi:rare lipoprotein A